MKTSTLREIERAMGEAADDIRMISAAAAKATRPIAGARSDLDPISPDGQPGMSAGWKAAKLVSALGRHGLFVIDDQGFQQAAAELEMAEWETIVSLADSNEDMPATIEYVDVEALVATIVRKLRP